MARYILRLTLRIFMGLLSSYLMTTKNVDKFFNTLITAQAPKVFTQRFLEDLDFKSTNDRLYIRILKGLGFLDANGTPTPRYFSFLDQSQSKTILAHAIEEAYSDLFAVNTSAHKMTVAEVKNKLRTLTQGQNSEKVLTLMANTFTALCKRAEWNSQIVETTTQSSKDATDQPNEPTNQEQTAEAEPAPHHQKNKHQLHYNIQIHLPESRDPAVYDALFKSLNKHIL